VRGFVLLVLACACAVATAAAPRPMHEAQAVSDAGELHTIATWLRLQGRDGYIGADVADAMGLARPQGELLAARQRGFRSGEVLRIAQIPDNRDADDSQDFLLFMVQQPDDHVYFYLSTLLGGLQKALVSNPSRNLVRALEPAEAKARWRAEVLYWNDRSAH
jgi:hypothetical protein